MKQKKELKTFMIISNLKNPLVSIVYTTFFSVVRLTSVDSWLNHSTVFIQYYSKTWPYRNALGTKFYSGLDMLRFRQGFCF